VSKYVAKVGRCFHSVISLQIDELSTYDSPRTIILVSSFVFYKIVMSCGSEINDGLLPESFTASRGRPWHREQSRGAFFCSQCVPKNVSMKLLFTETSVALIFYCLGSRTRTMVSRNTVGSHSVCNFSIQNNDTQLWMSKWFNLWSTTVKTSCLVPRTHK